MYIGLAEYYSAELSQKVKRGIHENRKKDLYCGGALLFGYRAVDRKIVVHEDEAKIVRLIFDQYAHGKDAKTILHELTAQGVKHHSKPFAVNTFYDMLHNRNISASLI